MKILLPEFYLLRSFFKHINWTKYVRKLPFFQKGNKLQNPFKQFSTVFSASIITLLFLISSAEAQNLKGQWIGKFNSVGSDPENKTDYIIEIEGSGDKINGFSYTYFSIAGKRFYVICKLEGIYDKGSKSLVVNEVETLKTNTPPEFQNCLQSHQLTYFKKSDKEILIGKWTPTKVGSDCGKGLTELERKFIEKIPINKNKAEGTLAKSTEKTTIKNAKTITPTPSTTKGNETPIVTEKSRLENGQIKNNGSQPYISTDEKISKVPEASQIIKSPNKEKEKLTERTKQFIKTIEVTGKSFHIDIYDNGQVDGDTITLFLNEKLLIPSKKLTTSPISIEVKIEDSIDIYDISMYAESLGTIPPNTALMIVTTSTDRYEINITSTEQTSGAVRFKVKR